MAVKIIEAKVLTSAALEAISAAAHAVGRPIIRAGSADFHFPDDTVLVALLFEGLAAKSVRLVRSSADADVVISMESGAMVYVTAGLRLVDIARILLTSDDEQAVSGSVTLDLSYLGTRFTSPPMAVQWPGGKGERQILELSSDREDRRKELIAHLNANRVYYSNAIHRSLDSGTIVAMLAEYSWNGRALIDQLEPRPLTMAGNYLVFRAPADPVDPSGVTEAGQPKAWGDLLHDRAITVGKQSADERLIPLPTTGVFAEAVLGRSNSAEKLDITRFWNWQDSPIPLTPTEIAPVSTGSRATAEDLKPGQLGQPVLNIVNPQTLPNPTGVGAVLGTLASPNMFRDMSGLAGTQGLVKTGMEETLQAATDAGQLASANMRTQAQKAVAMGQIAADIVKSVMGGGGGGGSGASQTMSGSGALINHGRSMDRSGAATSGAQGGGAGMLPGAGTSGSGGTGGGMNERDAYRQAVHGDLGASAADLARDSTAGMGAPYDTGADASGQPGGITSPGVQAEAATDPMFQQVSGTVIAPSYRQHLVGLIGELLIENALKKDGHAVFRPLYKSVSASGVDLITLAPDGYVWLIDNKAWMRGINGANALTASQSAGNQDVINILERWPKGPAKAQADLAAKAVKAGNCRLVVSNAFAGETVRFTKALFGKGLWVYDVRVGKMFSSQASWEAAIKVLTLQRGMRLTKMRGVATVGGVLLVLAASAAAGVILIRADSQAKALASSMAADLAAGLVVEQLSTKLFGIGSGPAGIAVLLLGLESDNPQALASQRREDLLAEIIPGFENLPQEDKDASRQAIRELLEAPFEIPEPQPQTGYTAPAGPYNPPSPPPPQLPPGTQHI
nr:hypothetical protein [uncultured Cupriavidus sp.]